MESGEITRILRALTDHIESRQYKGWDPYDALNSPLAGILTLGTKYGRIAFTQLLRRLPINIRPVLGIKPAINPKGLGLVLWGYAKQTASGFDSGLSVKMRDILAHLDRLLSKPYSGNCWGYHFPWQSRAAYLKRFTPTVVNSGFIGHALLDAARITGESIYLDRALRIKNFILKDLNRKHEGSAICFSYTPADHNYVHNANLLGASLLIRLNRHLDDAQVQDTALRSLEYTMNHQQPDGSWFYAETGMQRWIDSFHTGFNLISIRYFLEEGHGEIYRKRYQDGVRFYAGSFFLPDGTPRYYHNRTYPIDIHCPAMGLLFFSGEGPGWKDLSDSILQWMITRMRDPSGYFYFRKTPGGTNRVPYMRWSQAWVFASISEYLLHHGKLRPAK